MRAYWPPIAVQLLTSQYSSVRRLAASCIVWDKAEPAIRTILHDALNGQQWRTLISSVAQSRLQGGGGHLLYNGQSCTDTITSIQSGLRIADTLIRAHPHVRAPPPKLRFARKCAATKLSALLFGWFTLLCSSSSGSLGNL